MVLFQHMSTIYVVLGSIIAYVVIRTHVKFPCLRAVLDNPLKHCLISMHFTRKINVGLVWF